MTDAKLPEEADMRGSQEASPAPRQHAAPVPEAAKPVEEVQVLKIKPQASFGPSLPKRPHNFSRLGPQSSRLAQTASGKLPDSNKAQLQPSQGIKGLSLPERHTPPTGSSNSEDKPRSQTQRAASGSQSLHAPAGLGGAPLRPSAGTRSAHVVQKSHAPPQSSRLSEELKAMTQPAMRESRQTGQSSTPLIDAIRAADDSHSQQENGLEGATEVRYVGAPLGVKIEGRGEDNPRPLAAFPLVEAPKGALADNSSEEAEARSGEGLVMVADLGKSPSLEPMQAVATGADDGAETVVLAAPADRPDRLPVVCNGNEGIFVVDRHVIICLCSQCTSRAQEMGKPELELSPTDFERHSGSCTSKKWKYTVKVLQQKSSGESVPGMSVGGWLEVNMPTMIKGRGRTLAYSSCFGDIAPCHPKPEGRRSKRSKKRQNTQEGSPGAEKGTPPLQWPLITPSPEIDAGRQDVGRDESPEAPVAGVTAADLTSPSGKKWLSAAGEKTEVPMPPPTMRQGAQYQAHIPDFKGRKPGGREQDDRKAGVPGPTTLEALALAASYEKQASERLHIDAVADPEYHPGAAYDVRKLMVERGQRTRRKPRWLSSSVDPAALSKTKHLVVVDEPIAGTELKEEGDEQEEDLAPLSWRRTAVLKRKPLGSDPREDRKRMRPLSEALPHQLVEGRGLIPRQESNGAPRVLRWEVLNNGFMGITVAHNDQTFTGALMLQPGAPKPAESPSAYGRSGLSVTSREEGLASESASEQWDASRAPADSRPSWNHGGGADGGLTATSDAHGSDSYRGASKPNSSTPKTNQNRRTLANRDYERLQAEGPPRDARCALCRQQADPAAKGANRIEEAGDRVDFDALERKTRGLGPFLLVRVSAIMNAWVHMQCALWSPEVYVNNSGGVERASEAVRRGRMLKCKLCGEKGATLGCHKRSCRASFHLPCARQHACLLQGSGDDPYLVTCREHSQISNETELVPQMPVMPDQKIRTSPEKVPKRPRNARTEVSDSQHTSRQSQPPSGNGPRTTGWNHLPKMSTSLDTLSAAALAARNSNVESAANPLAAQHFGGTVGQSILRPGRCAVCVIQRKGVCGTQTAPKKCLRRIALSAAGKEIPDAPPGWRTRRPVAQWPATPHADGNHSVSPGRDETPGSQLDDREESVPLSNASNE